MQKGEHQQPCERLAVEAGHRDMPCAEADQAAQQAATTSLQAQLINTSAVLPVRAMYGAAEGRAVVERRRSARLAA